MEGVEHVPRSDTTAPFARTAVTSKMDPTVIVNVNQQLAEARIPQTEAKSEPFER